MVLITGDTHGLNDLPFLENALATMKDLSKSDYIIILGDVACCWDGKDYDRAVIQRLHNLPCSVLWIDGNHENFDILEQYPYSDMFGGKVQQITDDIFHLCRGQIYTIEDNTFFTFGGGLSIDRQYRQPGLSWWQQEMPSQEEYEFGECNLDAHDGRVDFILTHAAPRVVSKRVLHNLVPGEEELQDYLEGIARNYQYGYWLFGHLHREVEYEPYRCIGIYHNVYQIVEKKPSIIVKQSPVKTIKS